MECKVFNHICLGMTDLEEWTLACIVAVFGSLLSFGIILSRDQMIIQAITIFQLICLLAFDSLKGVLKMEDEDDGPEFAWKEYDIKQDIMKNKTKKNVALEFGLFSVVFLSFAIYNVYYWTKIYMYIQYIK